MPPKKPMARPYTENKPRANAVLSYKRGAYDLWVTKISQTFGMAGTSHQSRYRKDFYPKNNEVGVLQIEGICASRQDLAAMAKFVRSHQRNMADWRAGFGKSTGGGNLGPAKSGTEYLLKFSCPEEGLSLRGVVTSFKVENTGLMVPAPTYTLPFQVLVDSNSTDPIISTELANWTEVILEGRVILDYHLDDINIGW